jgi:DNA-binding CsgD family transcriptional regulator
VTPLCAELTERQEEVIVLIGEGLGLGEIGRRLGISRSTAKTHRDEARKRLCASSQSHAVAIVTRRRERGARP